MLRFGDYLSNALHDIKQLSGKKIGILQDEIGYAFDPPVSGDTIEKWRYRKTVLSAGQLEQLATAILAYSHATHQRDWLENFLISGAHPYPTSVCDKFFPNQTNLVDQGPSSQPAPVSILPAPPQSAFAPPAQSQFVGRTAEQEQIQTRLNSGGSLAICGMAGMGKTSLAMAVAHNCGETRPVFWHPFYDQNLNSFVRRLAGFLTHFGKTSLWEMLESARMAGIKPPDLTSCLDTLLAQLDGLNLLICLDDLQFVEEMPEIRTFVQHLSSKCQTEPQLALLITSRTYPAFLPADVPFELGGLGVEDSAELVALRQLKLPTDLVARLHTATEGSGAFLTLAIAALQASRDPALLISQLASAADIERFLLDEVNDRLSGQEQRVMEAVSILGGYPGSRDLLETLINQRDVRKTLRMLADQYLLTETDGEDGKAYQQHQIVRGFYYEQPSRKTRREMHQRAAEFYTDEEVNPFQAVFHYAKSGAAEQAVRIGQNNLWDVINSGLAAPLLQSLDSLSKAGLDQETAVDLLLTKGQLNHFLGEYDSGRDHYQQAAELLQTMPQNPTSDQLKGQVCLSMAQLLERRDPPEALTWAQRGIDILGAGDSELHTKLLIQHGTIMMYMGNSAGALESFMVNDDQLQALPLPLQTNINKNLGAVYFNLDQLDQAVVHSEQALQLSKQSHDHLQTSRIYINLGPTKYMLGDWTGAVSDLEEALAIAKRLGSHDVVLALHTNLGRCYVDKGDDELARQHLERAIALSEHASSLQLIAARINLARLAIFNRQIMQAQVQLTLAETDATEKNDQISLNTIKVMLAECLVVENKFPAARKLISTAEKMAAQLDDQTNLANLMRLKGQMATQDQNVEEAERNFHKSVDILTSIEPYQAACARLAWGESLQALGQQAAGEKLIQEAYVVFDSLGAEREKKRAGKLLSN